VVVHTVDALGLVRCTTYSVPGGWPPGFDQLMFTDVDDASTALGLTADKLAADAAAGLDPSDVWKKANATPAKAPSMTVVASAPARRRERDLLDRGAAWKGVRWLMTFAP
jgi:hypothetical protein